MARVGPQRHRKKNVFLSHLINFLYCTSIKGEVKRYKILIATMCAICHAQQILLVSSPHQYLVKFLYHASSLQRPVSPSLSVHSSQGHKNDTYMKTNMKKNNGDAQVRCFHFTVTCFTSAKNPEGNNW
jgi:hypothetical protein